MTVKGEFILRAVVEVGAIGAIVWLCAWCAAVSGAFDR